MLTNTFRLSLDSGVPPFTIHVSQNDKGESFVFVLHYIESNADISSGVSAEITGTKPNGKTFTHSASYSYTSGVGRVTVQLSSDMTDSLGKIPCEITLIKGTGNDQKRLSTSNFIIDVEKDPYLEAVAEELPEHPTLYYYNYDGSTLLYSERLSSGGNGTYAGSSTRPQDAHYTYSFSGWSFNPESLVVDSNAKKNVKKDRSIYAAFTETVRKYTVTFKNSDGTTLQTVSNVNFGATATYSGSTPEHPTNSDIFVFTGFEPSGANIQGDTICIADYGTIWDGKIIYDSWNKIFEYEDDGTYLKRYNVGDAKEITIYGDTYYAIIAYLNGDILSDNTGKAPITWILSNLYYTKHNMNSGSGNNWEGTNTNGWLESGMRSWLRSDVIYYFPSIVRNRIVEVKKTYYDYTTRSTLTSNDKIWIPSYRETYIPDADSYLIEDYFENSGIIYKRYFRNKHFLLKSIMGVNAKTNWWTRTACYWEGFSIYGFLSVNNSISSTSPLMHGISQASSSFGVLIGFCT